MTRKPLVLVTADVDRRGVEFGDPSLSLSWAYGLALEQAGALPMALPRPWRRKPPWWNCSPAVTVCC